MIIVRADTRHATCTSDDAITTGSVGIQVKFMLSGQFNGLSAVAVFRSTGASVDVALMSNTCVVPPEVLRASGAPLYIGVYARNSAGTVVIPTVWTATKDIQPGTRPSGVNPSEPTPDWTAQVQLAAQEAVQTSEQAIENSERAIEIAGGAQAAADDARQSADEAAQSATAAADAQAATEGALANFAPAFSESVAYTAGQYVTYTDGKLYRFVADHAAGAWDSADVRAVTTGAELAELKSHFDDSERTLSMMVSKNKIDIATITKNAAINNVSTSPNYGKLYTENGYNTTDFIPISKGDFVRMYRSTSTNPVEGSTLFGNDGNEFRIAEYNSAREIIYCSENWVAIPYTVRTDGAAFIRVSASNANFYMLFVNEESSAQPYYKAYKPEWAAISDLENVFNPAEVILPSALYGVTGQQINIYKENLVAGNRLKSLAYIHTLMPDDAIQSDERTIWNPAGTALVEATKNWEVFKYGLENQPETRPIKICNVPKSTGNAAIKVLVIGDSKVAGGFVTYHFLHSFDDDSMSCTLLGTQYSWSPVNRHEGYGGRTAQWICTNESSPFCNNGAFDFAHYLSANSIDIPDYVFINLGTNDVAQTASGYVENFITYITQMVDGIHSVSASIKVIVGMCEGVCTTQDMNNAGFLNWDLNRKISILHKATIAAFDNRASENIYVCPMYMGMDLTQDYNMTEVPLSSWDEELSTGKTRFYVTDTVHQSSVGYGKNADYMYALVKYITAKALA